MQEINLRNYAYLGDAVWELFIREKTILLTNNANKLHKLTTSVVNMNTQCELLHYLEDKLTAEEQELAVRARNLPIPSGRRNMQKEYRQSTAFEALIGWWYVHDKDRYNQMLEMLKGKIL